MALQKASRQCCQLIFLVLLCVFNQNVLFVTCNEENSTLSSQSQEMSSAANPTLKLCASAETSLAFLKNDTIQIPAFQRKLWMLNLTKFQVDEQPLETCSNGEAPTPVEDGTVTKAAFDDEIHGAGQLLMVIMRQVHFIMDNGYLSIGNSTNLSAKYFAPNEYCISGIKDNGEASRTVHVKTCPVTKSDRSVLRKCCPVGMLLNDKVDCVDNQDKHWDLLYMDAKTWKMLPLEDVNPVIISPLLRCNGEAPEFWDMDECDHEFHPVTDNSVAFLGAFRKWEFLPAKTDWCIETMMETKTDHKRMVFFHCVKNNTQEDKKKEQARVSLVYMIAMYIGAGFHLMTTLVYLITWPKQNIHGKTLCSCTGSLFFMQLFMGTAHLLGRLKNQRKTPLCIGNGIGGQYFMIAAFTWLLIVNFDLWRTFRSMRTEGGKSKKRFMVYSTVGWAFPTVISAISIALDYTFTCRRSRVPVPEFGEYYCFVAPWAQGIYVYYILGLLMAMSCIFAALTLFGLYTFKKEAVNLRSTRGAQDQQNILLFLKLSVVMGLTWVFEVISWAATRENENHIMWIILDLYNTLSAILIFLIFVCKKTTLNLLEQSIPKLKGVTGALSKLTSTFSGESTSDNTVSTAAAGHANGSGHKKTNEVQVPSVHFTKEKASEPENGSMEQTEK